LSIEATTDPNSGFSAHTELSLAYNGVIESILVGNKIFL
jgi:hypothetical protein